MTEKQRACLIPLQDRPEAERKALASKAGKASAAKKQYNKTFKQALQWALEMPALKGNPDVEKIRKQFGQVTNRDAIVIALTAKAIKEGDVKAFAAIRDTTGELPAQTVNVKNTEPIKISIETVD